MHCSYCRTPNVYTDNCPNCGAPGPIIEQWLNGLFWTGLGLGDYSVSSFVVPQVPVNEL
jgi:hypothetical protein